MELNDLDRKILDLIPRIRARHNACTWGEVARQLGISKPYLSTRATLLTAAGYVTGGGRNDVPGSVIVVKRPGDPLPPPTVTVGTATTTLPVMPNVVAAIPPPPPSAPTPIDDELAAQIAAAAATINVPQELIEKAKMQSARVTLTPEERKKEIRNGKDRAKRAAAGKKTTGPRANQSPRARKVAEATGRGKIDGRVAQHRRPVKQEPDA